VVGGTITPSAIYIQSGTATLGAAVTTGSLNIASGATLTAGSHGITIQGGTWTNNGTFTPGTGTVTFNGATVNGATSFNHVVCTGTVTFNLNDTQTVGGNFTLNNTTAPVVLQSSGAARWYLTGGTLMISNMAAAANTVTISGCYSNIARNLSPTPPLIDGGANYQVFSYANVPGSVELHSGTPVTSALYKVDYATLAPGATVSSNAGTGGHVYITGTIDVGNDSLAVVSGANAHVELQGSLSFGASGTLSLTPGSGGFVQFNNGTLARNFTTLAVNTVIGGTSFRVLAGATGTIECTHAITMNRAAEAFTPGSGTLTIRSTGGAVTVNATIGNTTGLDSVVMSSSSSNVSMNTVLKTNKLTVTSGGG
jgi:hypothetical protein